ncbi:hypothetical protein TNCV_2480631 [Trichonephila clavipes]|nr:hypothetical protein TNCV_2480631 [Trichonephila clavipes]
MLDVSMSSVVQRLQYNPKILCQKTHQHLPARAAARCKEEEYCEIVFICMQEDQLCVPLNGRQRRNRCWAHVSWTHMRCSTPIIYNGTFNSALHYRSGGICL